MLEKVRLYAPKDGYVHEVDPAGAVRSRAFIRDLIASVRQRCEVGWTPLEGEGDVPAHETDDLIPLTVQASIPAGGFQRTEVSRLVLTFGRTEDVVPVPLGIFLKVSEGR